MVKAMDLKVITAVEDFSDLPGGSIWPAIIPRVMDLIEAHRTTLIFANSRRQAERAADRLNDLYVSRRSGGADGPEAMMEGGAVKGLGKEWPVLANSERQRPRLVGHMRGERCVYRGGRDTRGPDTAESDLHPHRYRERKRQAYRDVHRHQQDV